MPIMEKIKNYENISFIHRQLSSGVLPDMT